ncbi:MAG: glycosyltransferase family 4 protein [Xanthobacteraceae bacterium]
MNIAFGIVSLVPKGGLQLDCVALARMLKARGHNVTIFTTRPFQFDPPSPDIVVLPVRSFTNHGRDIAFARAFRSVVHGRFDRIVGFNKLLDLELLYCADPSVHDKRRKWLVRAMPRHRAQMQLEEACFAPANRTIIMALSQASADSYRHYWKTPEDRFTVLPPVVNPHRHRPELRSVEHRASNRRAFDLPARQPVWLWVGTKAKTKGLDRAIAALRSIPEAFLAVLGLASDSPESRGVWPRIQSAGLSDRVRFLGYRDSVPEVMAAADLLVHPTRRDVTGQVVMEAVVNGLPVITSKVCGFAKYVAEADAGIILSEPYRQGELETALRDAMNQARNAAFSQNGLHYGLHHFPMTGLVAAADFIENKGRPASP